MRVRSASINIAVSRKNAPPIVHAKHVMYSADCMLTYWTTLSSRLPYELFTASDIYKYVTYKYSSIVITTAVGTLHRVRYLQIRHVQILISVDRVCLGEDTPGGLNLRPKAKSGDRGGVLGDHLGGLSEHCQLPQRGYGQSPDLKCISDVLRALQKTRLQMSFSFSFWCSVNLRFLGGAIAP